MLLFISWAASLIATLGSLFFSEIMKYIPCSLCWYQRIFMYPFVVILAMAMVKKDYKVYSYSIALSGIGLVIALYHTLLQKVPFLQENSLDCGIVPCTTDYIDWLGFITIPFMALVAFTIIFVCMVYMRKLLKEEK
jgi:disulfide bond formation protein DsbB